MKRMFIAVDFDGTCVTHEYPFIGKKIGAAPVLRELAKKHDIILYTMRDGEKLQDAVAWFKQNGIPLYAVNENPSQKVWTDSPKVFAHLYIDDAALGTLTHTIEGYSDRDFVDWYRVVMHLASAGFFSWDRAKELAEEIKKDFNTENHDK